MPKAVERFLIKLFDQTLASFNYVSEGRNPAYACNLEIDPATRHLLPLNIAAEPTDDELMRFLGSRRIPKNRAYAAEILRPFGISLDDTKAVIELTKGASVNDSFLVVAEDDPATFRECNLFENDFNVALQIAAYTGTASRGVLDDRGLPSELTASGQFAKAWRVIGDKRVLFKAGGQLGQGSHGIEPFSEFLACQVANAMGIEAVQYGLTTWQGRLCSTCELLNSKDVSFVPLYACVPRREVARMGIDRALELFFSISPAESTRLLSMLAFDVAVANKDRHFGNYGVLRDNASGKVVCMAPLLDHNLSLFCGEPDDGLSLEALEAAAHRYASAFGADLRAQLDDVVEDVQRAQLARLVDFEFELDDALLDDLVAGSTEAAAFTRRRLESLGAYVRHIARTQCS